MMAWRVVSRLLGVVSILLLARLLMPSDFGVVALATAVVSGIDALSQMGVRDALLRLPDDRREYYDAAFTLQVLRGIATGIVLATLSPFAEALFGDRRLSGILLALASFAVFGGFENIGTVSYARALDFRVSFFMQIVPRAAGFLLTVTLAFLLRDYRALIWGVGVAKLVGVAVSYLASPYRPAFGLAGCSSLLGFSVLSWAIGLALMVWTRGDAFLLAPVLGPALFGTYALASELALLPVTEILEPASTTLFPGFALAHRSGGSAAANALTVAAILLLISLPLALGISACAGYLVTGLLGPQWAGARSVITVLAWASIFSPFSFVCSSVLMAQGRLRSLLSIIAAAALIKVLVILAIRGTHDLTLISAGAVGVVAIEAGLFFRQLRATNRAKIRPILHCLCRATAAAGLTAAALVLVPGTWQSVLIPRFGAFAAGIGLGVLALSLFAIAQMTLWHLARQPDGPEAVLLKSVAGWLPTRLDLRRAPR
jgi:lipopolysaccharide exporter